jgi:hypothetical protein
MNAAAQFGTGNIVGTVRDPSGAVIPGASVTVANPARGYVRHLVTNSDGTYAISSLPIGTYQVTFKAKGFVKVLQTGITLTTGQTQRVDATLKVGTVATTVTVQGNVPRIQTETAAISSVVTSQQIENLEINGRNFVRLALLVPGAVPDNGLQTSTVGVAANNSISFNGSRMQYNNWMVDGAPNTDEGSASTFNTYPNLDSIAEFRISTSNYGAEYGHHAGATIDVATKAGTSQFHGDAFEFLRNDALDANPWFINGNATGVANAPKAPLKQNEYGWTLGGPVYIPGIYNTKKDKTFFFWSEDWRKIRGSNPMSSGVPSLLERQGDFSQCDPNSPNFNAVVASGCVLPTVNGVTYDNVNQVPGANPQAFTNATDLLNGLVPLPNSGPAGWSLAATSATNWREDQIRVDQNVSDKTHIFVRYTQDSWNTVSVPSLWSWSNYDTIKTPFNGPGKSAVLNITHSFTPTLMNEFIMGYTEDWIDLGNAVGPDSVAGSINRPSNFQLAHFFPANSGNPLLPGLVACGGGPCIAEDASNHPWHNSNPVVDVSDNVAWIHGNHNVKVGAYFENYRKNEQFGADTQGYLQAANWASNTTGNGLADLFLGRIASYNEGTETLNGIPVGGYPKGHWHYNDFEPYVQDQWHVNRKLTLDLGLRYYYFTHIHDVNNPNHGGVDSGFLPQLYNPAAEARYNSSLTLIQGTGALPTAFGNGLVNCGANGIPLGCQTDSYLNFAPRFGFAYRLGQNSVIRGGYGIYFEPGNGNEAQAEGGEGNPPIALDPSISNFTGYNTVQPIFANGIYSAPIPPTSYTAWPYSQKWGSEQQFSLGVQHQFGSDNLLTVSYVGMLGRHLASGYFLTQVPIGLGTVNVPQLAGDGPYCDAAGNCNAQQFLINQAGSPLWFQPFPGYSSITMKADGANSNYNSLQAEFRHTFGHGLTWQVAYTWAHAIDNSSQTYTSTKDNVDSQNLARWYSTSSFNRTQVFTTSYIYNLPFFQHSNNHLLRAGLGGWELSGITTFFTGEPVTFGCGVNGFSTGIGGSVMCNTIGPLKIDKGVYNDPTYGPRVQWFNPGVITQPLQSQLAANNEPGMFGYMGRNVLTGPGRDNTDLALIKNFNTHWFGDESQAFQFRWETFNTFNHPEWQYFNAGCSGSDTFGQACNSPTNDIGNGEVTGAWPNRIMQFGLKILW